MPEAVSKVVESYRRALFERDWPTRTGTLLGLVRMLLHPTSPLTDHAKATAEEIIRIEDEERKV